jgi:acetyl-CoA C-acetyltransferase
MSNEDIFIVGAARTPMGAFQGSFATVSAPQLGAASIREALVRARVSASDVQETWFGNVISAGVGQAPARQAAIYAGVTEGAPATTVNKVCGSGLHAVVLGAKSIKCDGVDLLIAGGMESMSTAPYILPKARSGLRMGHGEMIDTMIHDGIWDPYNNIHMAGAGELCAREYKISREEQDEFATESYKRALDAQKSGRVADEIVAVTVDNGKQKIVVDTDEEPGRGRLEKFASLRPAFEKNGTITAANASKINDGAAAVVLASANAVERRELKPMARIVSYAYHAQAPNWFTTAPAVAIDKALAKANLKRDDIGLFEVNEAFSVVGIITERLAKLDRAKVNVRGGAVALGHPIGCSGARILTTLLFAMRERGTQYGLATLCIGGGEAIAVIVEACA